MKYGTVSSAEYPIVVSKTEAIDPTIEQIDQYFDEIIAVLDATTGPYVFISYSEDSKFISSHARIHIGKRADEITLKYANRNKGSIIVGQGVMSQIMLKAIALVYKPLKDAIIVSSLDEAKSKAKEILQIS